MFVRTVEAQQILYIYTLCTPRSLKPFTHAAPEIRTHFLHPLLFAVAQECPKQTAVQVVQDGDQEVFIKLECCRELKKKTKTASLLYLRDQTILRMFPHIRAPYCLPASSTARHSRQTVQKQVSGRRLCGSYHRDRCA